MLILYSVERLDLHYNKTNSLTMFFLRVSLTLIPHDLSSLLFALLFPTVFFFYFISTSLLVAVPLAVFFFNYFY